MVVRHTRTPTRGTDGQHSESHSLTPTGATLVRATARVFHHFSPVLARDV